MEIESTKSQAARKHSKHTFCHSEPFACHSDGAKRLKNLAQDKLREESHDFNKLQNKDSSANASE